MTSLNTMVFTQVPFLRTSREFPENLQQLTQEVNKSYVDIASAVNSRVIGIYPINRPASTGETWYITPGRINQAFRQVYAFSNFSSPMSIPHGINFNDVSNFTAISGTATDGTNYYPLPYVDVVNVTNQINVMLTQNDIVITAGAGSPPAITNGLVILSWLVN